VWNEECLRFRKEIGEVLAMFLLGSEHRNLWKWRT